MKSIEFIAYESFCSIGITDKRQDIDKILSHCKKLAFLVQETLNMYDSESELSRMCKFYEPGKPYKISALMYRFIQVNLQASKLTGGKFDFTLGSLKKCWNFVTEKPEIPTEQIITNLMTGIGFENVTLLGKDYVIFKQRGICLDPGGSGKGIALDLIYDYLREEGVTGAVLNFGGQIMVIGSKESGESWKIGLKDPDNRKDIYKVIEVKDASISTSSWYEHYFKKEGKIYSHILDPKKGKPIESDVKSVTVVCTQGVWADILSTAVFLLGKEKGIRLLELIKEREKDNKMWWSIK